MTHTCTMQCCAKTEYKPIGCCSMDYHFHCLLADLCKVKGEMCVSKSVALVLIESDKQIQLTVRGHRPILFCIIVFIFWADLLRS